MDKRSRAYALTGGRCFYCGQPICQEFHLDHFNPKSKGGKNIDNLVPSCPDCNLYKSDLTIEQFREKISSSLTNSIHGRMLGKYYGIKPRQVKFFFEEVDDGDLQNHITELLDRQQGGR